MHGVEIYTGTFIFYYFYAFIKVSGIFSPRTKQSKKCKKIRKSVISLLREPKSRNPIKCRYVSKFQMSLKFHMIRLIAL